MSSLLQHHGGRSTCGRKIEILFYLVHKGPEWETYCGPGSYNPRPDSTAWTMESEPVTLADGKTRPKLYRVFRRPVGILGCWVQFRYNGEIHVPDLSVPVSVFKLPRDARPLSDEEALAYWTSK